MLIEKLNINFKEKLNMNVHLLIGGNNIKYQLKSLKKKKNNNNKNININKNLNVNINSNNNSNNNYYYDKDNHVNDKMDRHHINDKHSNEQHVIQSSFCDEENINIYIGTPGRLHKLIHEKKNHQIK